MAENWHAKLHIDQVQVSYAFTFTMATSNSLGYVIS